MASDFCVGERSCGNVVAPRRVKAARARRTPNLRQAQPRRAFVAFQMLIRSPAAPPGICHFLCCHSPFTLVAPTSYNHRQKAPTGRLGRFGRPGQNQRGLPAGLPADPRAERMGTRVDNRAFDIEHPPLAISDSAANLPPGHQHQPAPQNPHDAHRTNQCSEATPYTWFAHAHAPRSAAARRKKTIKPYGVPDLGRIAWPEPAGGTFPPAACGASTQPGPRHPSISVPTSAMRWETWTGSLISP